MTDVPPDDAREPDGARRDVRARVARVRALTRWLDTSIRIPGTGWTIGLDPFLGLVPWLGDALGAGLSAWLIWQSARLGASGATLIRMLWNVAVETLLGVIPVAGDVFDAAWKANSRNLALLERHLADPSGLRTASRRFWTGVGLGLVAAVAGTVVLSWWLLVSLLRVMGLG